MDATMLSTDGEFPSHHNLKRFFSHCGFRVEISRSRQEWLTKTRALAPEIVMIDLDASWGGEAAMAAFWAEVERGAAVPAVFVIGNAPPSALARRTGIPPSACFQKPVSMESLLDGVGLAIAQADLARRTGEPRPRFRRAGRPVHCARCLA